MIVQENSRMQEDVHVKVTVVHAQAPPEPAPSFVRALLLAGVGGLLLWLCYFPVAWTWLAWVALVPSLALARSRLRGKKFFWASYVAGSVFFWSAIHWMRVADDHLLEHGFWRGVFSIFEGKFPFPMHSCWAMLAVYCAFYFPVGLALIRWLDRRTRVPFCLSVSLVWVGLEWVRSFLLTGFAWYYLGHTQHEMLMLIQVADLAGVYAVSFLVVMVNAWLFMVLYQSETVRSLLQLEEPPPEAGGMPWNIILQGTGVFFLIVAACGYGAFRLGQEQFKPGPRVALLQSNLDQRLRNQGSAEANEADRAPASQKISEHMFTLCDRAASYSDRAKTHQPDLVIWPETSYHYPWFEIDSALDFGQIPAEWKFLLENQDAKFGQDALQRCRTNHLFGTSYYRLLDEKGRRASYNSAVLLSKNGTVKDRYDKIHRVPFGEYIPMRDWLPFMNAFSPYDFDYSIRAGEKMTRFTLGNYRFGSLICYEDTDPFLARRYAVDDEDGKPVDFLVNITNDGWFDGSAEHDEHLAISRFRAIECRRSLVRAVNMGISAVIDGSGRIWKPTDVRNFLPGVDPEHKVPGELPRVWQCLTEVDSHGERMPELPASGWKQFKKSYGVLIAVVPIDDRSSLYAQWGDWLPIGCWGIFAGCVLVVWRRGRIQR